MPKSFCDEFEMCCRHHFSLRISLLLPVIVVPVCVCVCLCAAGVAACRFFCCCLLPFLSKTLFLFINKHSARFLHIAIDADINIIRCKCHASAPNATQWTNKKMDASGDSVGSKSYNNIEITLDTT